MSARWGTVHTLAPIKLEHSGAFAVGDDDTHLLTDSEHQVITFKTSIEAQRFCDGYNRCLERIVEEHQQ